MSIEWISKPIFCQGKKVSPGLVWTSPLLPERDEVSFKIRLVMKSWEMIACEGRLCSYEDFDLMDNYKESLRSESLNEDSLCKIIDNFGNDLPGHLQGDPIEVDPRSLLWTKRS